jgi:hypothetical protein
MNKVGVHGVYIGIVYECGPFWRQFTFVGFLYLMSTRLQHNDDDASRDEKFSPGRITISSASPGVDLEIISNVLSIVASHADIPPLDLAYLRNQRPEPITSSPGEFLPPNPFPLSKFDVLVEFSHGSQ